jgi:hypothetical protein
VPYALVIKCVFQGQWPGVTFFGYGQIKQRIDALVQFVEFTVGRCKRFRFRHGYFSALQMGHPSPGSVQRFIEQLFHQLLMRLMQCFVRVF